MRPLVSYDDIASQAPVQESESSTHAGGSGSPPKKRRKNGNNRQRQRTQYHNSHYEEEYKDPPPRPPRKPRKDYGLNEESRQLTHDEVWDDSALIRAWDAAVEEYEVLNGSDKRWKAEPVNKSAIWFNIPPEEQTHDSVSPGASFLMPSIPTAFVQDPEQEQIQEPEPEQSDPDNSRPVNFDTYVPRHDPSLSDGKDTSNGKSAMHRGVVPPPPAGQVTQAEAFEHAMGAWYWAGYWTGVYHNTTAPREPQANDEGDTIHEAVELQDEIDVELEDEITMELEDDEDGGNGDNDGNGAHAGLHVGGEDLIPTLTLTF